MEDTVVLQTCVELQALNSEYHDIHNVWNSVFQSLSRCAPEQTSAALKFRAVEETLSTAKWSQLRNSNSKSNN